MYEYTIGISERPAEYQELDKHEGQCELTIELIVAEFELAIPICSLQCTHVFRRDKILCLHHAVSVTLNPSLSSKQAPPGLAEADARS